MLFLYIVDLDLFAPAHTGIVGRQPPGLLKRPVREFFSVCLYDDMGPRRLLCVEPPVVSGGKVKGQLIVLEIVFSYIYMISVAGNIVEWSVLHFLFLAGELALDISALREFFLNPRKVVFGEGDIKGGSD